MNINRFVTHDDMNWIIGWSKFRKHLLFVLFICFVCPAFGQATITTASLLNGEVGADYGLLGETLDATVSGAAVDVCWNVTGLPPGLSLSGGVLGGCAATGLSVNLVGTPTMSGTFFPQFTATGLDGSNNPVGADDMETISIQIDAASGTPVHTMLVLDRSGSMNGTVPGLNVTSYGAEITSDSKWNVLKIVCNDFLQEFDNLRNEPADEIAMQFFNNSHTEFPGGFFLFDDLPISNNLNLATAGSLLEYMGDAANQPTSMTCIGGAIQTGYNDFPGGVVEGNIIVFTDGMQNRDPSVSIAGDNIELTGLTVGTGFDPNPPELDLTSLTNVRIHTIHLGDNSAATLMNDVSTASGGEHFSIRNISGTETAEDQLNEFLTGWDQTLVNSLDGLSPKLAKVVSANTVSGKGTQMFIVDNMADMILFKIVKYEPSTASVLISKDGTVVIKRSQREFIDHYRITSPMLNDMGLAMGGEWTVEISAEPSSMPYYISLFIEEEALRFNTSIGDKSYEPGDQMDLAVYLTYNNGTSTSTIKDADSVIAVIAKPGQDFNDVFAMTSVDKPVDANEPNQSPGETKYNSLIQNSPEFRKAIALSDQIFPLTNNGDGSYIGKFSDTELSGIYRVAFYIKGQHPDLGTYQRYEQKSTIIDFGEADASQTDFQYQVIDNAHQILITPKNKFNHFIGPNRLGQIAISYNDKKLDLVDQLNGTYVATLPGGFDPSGNIKVSIKGVDFYDGTVEDINKDDGDGGGFCNWVENTFNVPCWVGIIILIILIIIIILLRRRSGNN